MRPPTPIPEERIRELEEFRKAKWPGFEFMRFLCVWLRVAQNMTTGMIAKTIGWHVNTVRFTQKSFIDHGISALTESKKGGRYHSLMSKEEEASFLSQFDDAGGKGSILVANDIKTTLEKHLGHEVHIATVYRILHRHGWRKIVPRPQHPKRSQEAADAFKKRASQSN
ncbi:transcriptional regulator [Synergistales bacterium]|nr:transcriptional regulator [Synergistales bacterium]